MREILLLALAGALGAVARHGVGLLAARLLGPGFPWGTLLVNVSGSFALGVLVQIGASTDWLPPQARLALATGLLGAFTTFSTFSVETVRLAESSGWGWALGNVGANLLLGLAAAGVGIWVARATIG